MKKILLTNKYDKEPYQIIQSAVPEFFELLMLEEISQKELEEKALQADYILASGRLKINKQVLDCAKNLKMIQRTGVGLDSLDLAEIKTRNIPVYVNYGVNAESVAEHAVLLMLACLRKLTVVNQNTKNGIWQKQAQGIRTRELRTQTVGIIGMGNIGRHTVKRLNAFGANILYYSRHRLDEKSEAELQADYTGLDELLEKSDIISLHCPLTEETSGLICKTSIEKMKDGVIIINTARGPLIKENDLITGLQCGKIGFAGIDVFEKEPTDNTALLTLDNVIVTPHIGGITYDSFYNMMHDAMRNIELFETGNLQDIQKYKLEL